MELYVWNMNVVLHQISAMQEMKIQLFWNHVQLEFEDCLKKITKQLNYNFSISMTSPKKHGIWVQFCTFG